MKRFVSIALPFFLSLTACASAPADTPPAPEKTQTTSQAVSQADFDEGIVPWDWVAPFDNPLFFTVNCWCTDAYGRSRSHEQVEWFYTSLATARERCLAEVRSLMPSAPDDTRVDCDTDR